MSARMEEFRNFGEHLLAWVFLPATLLGAAGGIMGAVKRRKSWKQIIFEGAGGMILSNVVYPLVAEYAPPEWHYSLFFLVGWGGVQGVGHFYEVVTSALESRVREKLGGSNDNNRHD